MITGARGPRLQDGPKSSLEQPGRQEAVRVRGAVDEQREKKASRRSCSLLVSCLRQMPLLLLLLLLVRETVEDDDDEWWVKQLQEQWQQARKA